jgi:UDP-3-O-[3-hydroxymyristoyl] N-acetylglucosamine deacetylase/3-hydroxyacyl-[acyl-carrier-protein] dehydratase
LSRKQKTIANPVTVSGKGLHTNEEATLVLKPAEPGTGVVFVRTDLPDHPRIPAVLARIDNRDRRTTLRSGDGEVQTVEHLLASLFGLGLDNVEVEISGGEVPGLDGSALGFVEAVREAGAVEQDAERETFTLDREIAVDLPQDDVTIVALPANGGLTIQYTLDYGVPEIPLQHLSLTLTPENFAKEIAPARTFCLKSEAQALLDAGLGQGATYENTLVVGEDGEPIDNQLRLPDEYVRHKVLDLIGDLSLLGLDLNAKVIAVRSGHTANVELARAMRDRYDGIQREKDRARHQLDIREIMRILPHRFPFLLIDRVVELDGFRRAVGVKNVSINEPFFQGHWPAQPVMPGVLIVEAMAQLSGVLLLRKLEHTGKLAVLLSIDRVKLRRAVVPGDQLLIESVAENVKARTGRVLCRATVEGKLAAEARIKFMLVDAQ